MTRARAVGRALLLLLVWPVRTVPRLLTLGWLIACGVVGGALQAAADGDGLINGPDLGGGFTVFERIPLTSYTLPFGLSDSETGFPYVKEVMWEAFRGIGNVLLYLTLAVVKGAITCMQWMLNLTIYRDNSGEIDRAVQSLAGAVFWPMLAVTVAIAAASAYGRMKQHGGGSIFNDALWMITATTIAVTFAVAPSKVAGTLDDVRTSLSGAITQGYTSSASADSVAGFPPTVTPNDKDGATLALSDAMWNVYAVAPWCWAAFGSLDVCRDVGHDYLEDTTRWKDLYNAQRTMNGDGDDTDSAKCPDEYQSQCTWVRGQSFGRLGGALFAALIGIPLAVMLMVLVVFGIMSIVGLVLLTLIGLLFLLLWMIPGKPRAIGVRWFEALLGSLLQSVLITALLGAVMVLAGIFNAMLPTYGLFMVALLNVAALIMVFKIRGMFENMTGLASPGSSHIASGYMGARLLGSVAGGAKKLGAGTTKAAVGTAAAAGKTGMKVAQAGTNQIINPNSATSKATRGTMAALKAGLDLASQSGTPAPTPKRTVHATPYRTAPTGITSAGQRRPRAEPTQGCVRPGGADQPADARPARSPSTAAAP